MTYHILSVKHLKFDSQLHFLQLQHDAKVVMVFYIEMVLWMVCLFIIGNYPVVNGIGYKYAT